MAMTRRILDLTVLIIKLEYEIVFRDLFFAQTFKRCSIPKLS